jgi:hypothetical protein
LNRIEAQFTALRYSALVGANGAGNKEQGSVAVSASVHDSLEA